MLCSECALCFWKPSGQLNRLIWCTCEAPGSRWGQRKCTPPPPIYDVIDIFIGSWLHTLLKVSVSFSLDTRPLKVISVVTWWVKAAARPVRTGQNVYVWGAFFITGQLMMQLSELICAGGLSMSQASGKEWWRSSRFHCNTQTCRQKWLLLECSLVQQWTQCGLLPPSTPPQWRKINVVSVLL